MQESQTDILQSQTTGIKKCKPLVSREKNNPEKSRKSLETYFPSSGLTLFTVSGDAGVFPKTKACPKISTCT